MSPRKKHEAGGSLENQARLRRLLRELDHLAGTETWTELRLAADQRRAEMDAVKAAGGRGKAWRAVAGAA